MNDEVTPQEQAWGQLEDTLNAVKFARPGDRSMKDRAYAVVITDLERIVAYYDYWINNDHFE